MFFDLIHIDNQGVLDVFRCNTPLIHALRTCWFESTGKKTKTGLIMQCVFAFKSTMNASACVKICIHTCLKLQEQVAAPC